MLGGYQFPRGTSEPGWWFVENIFEELDQPTEWFLDLHKSMLYLYPNGSVPSEQVIGSRLPTVVRVAGSAQAPARNITLQGLHFAHTRQTFLDTYETPSGGGYSLHRGAAVEIEVNWVSVGLFLFFC